MGAGEWVVGPVPKDLGNWQLATVATGNSPHQSCWQLLKLKYRTLLRTLKGWYTVVYLVSQSGLVKSDWSVTQKWSTGRPAGEQKV